jgi:hypothetical protein
MNPIVTHATTTRAVAVIDARCSAPLEHSPAVSAPVFRPHPCFQAARRNICWVCQEKALRNFQTRDVLRIVTVDPRNSEAVRQIQSAGLRFPAAFWGWTQWEIKQASTGMFSTCGACGAPKE